MRNIYICDTQGNIIQEIVQEEGYFGLPYRVWAATDRCITMQHQDKFQILAQLWEYYHGPEGDAFLSPNEIDLLLQDIEHLKPLLKDIEPGRIKGSKTELREIETFFYNLTKRCQKAKARNLSLKFVAD